MLVVSTTKHALELLPLEFCCVYAWCWAGAQHGTATTRTEVQVWFRPLCRCGTMARVRKPSCDGHQAKAARKILTSYNSVCKFLTATPFRRFLAEKLGERLGTRPSGRGSAIPFLCFEGCSPWFCVSDSRMLLWRCLAKASVTTVLRQIIL